MFNEATDGLAPSVFAIFWAQLEWILAFFANERRRPGARNHGFGFASCSRGLAFPDGDIAGPNANTAFDLLSNTPQTKGCCSGSPHPIFHRGPLRRLPWMTCHILAGSST